MEKTNIHHTNLGKEFLNAAVSWRGNLGLHEILNELPMSTFSIKQRVRGISEDVAEVSRATAFLLRGINGMEMLLWDGARAGPTRMAEGVSDGAAEGAIEGLPTTLVLGAEALVAKRVVM